MPMTLFSYVFHQFPYPLPRTFRKLRFLLWGTTSAAAPIRKA